jgi:hypothetical protein
MGPAGRGGALGAVPTTDTVADSADLLVGLARSCMRASGAAGLYGAITVPADLPPRDGRYARALPKPNANDAGVVQQAAWARQPEGPLSAGRSR